MNDWPIYILCVLFMGYVGWHVLVDMVL